MIVWVNIQVSTWEKLLNDFIYTWEQVKKIFCIKNADKYERDIKYIQTTCYVVWVLRMKFLSGEHLTTRTKCQKNEEE